MSESPQILFEDDHLLLINKPSGWFVHPPENPRYRRGLRRRTCTQWLQDVHGKKAYPAHRIDAATEGLFICGKNKSATAHLNLQFKNHETVKVYQAAVRGWLAEEAGKIEIPLLNNTSGEMAACETHFRVLARIEQPFQVGKKFATSRYTLLDVSPHTGRWHQIRRHMNRVSHPIIGDREHGDSHHNRYFRDTLNIDGLCLWAKELKITHPASGEKLKFSSPVSPRWLQLANLFNFKPS